MRLYLSANSKKNIGYTPDWLKVTYEDNGHLCELTLDIQGSIDYDKESLNCRCKGDLIPWTLLDYDVDVEVDLYELSKESVEAIYSNKRIAEIICEGHDHRVGVYPVNDNVFEEALMDVFSDYKGYFEMHVDGHDYKKEFKFDTEVNF